MAYDDDTASPTKTGAESYAAIITSHKPNPRGPGYLKLYAMSSLCFLCSTMSGFDSACMGSINALPNYTSYFGLPREGNASTGIIFSIFPVRRSQLFLDTCGARETGLTDP